MKCNFFKNWYTLAEASHFLSDYFESQNETTLFNAMSGKRLFDIADILAFYRERKIPLAIHIQELNSQKETLNLFDSMISTPYFLTDFSSDEIIQESDIETEKTALKCSGGIVVGEGYFYLPQKKTTFSNGDFLISALEIPPDLNKSEINLGLSFPTPFCLPLEKVIILRADLMRLMLTIDEENKSAKAFFENAKKEPAIEETPYNPKERDTHLKAIAYLSVRLAESNKASLMTSTDKINATAISNILEREDKGNSPDWIKGDTFRKRLQEAKKYFQTASQYPLTA